jgi:ligand-binding SRPBCC domain-containing protein
VRKFREKHMRPPFRSKQEVIINAPLETVWAFNMVITKTPTFHPRVVKSRATLRKSSA